MAPLGAILVFLLAVAHAAPAGDQILALPGWYAPLPSAQYSGFISVGTPPGYPTGEMFMHYWFVESLGNPKTDPVVVWYNGGPGASSLFGLLVELGPFMLNADSYDENYNLTGVPSLIYNNYTWAAGANILVVDNPPPVGFSYCNPIGPTGNGTSCGSWNDTLTAQTNLIFLAEWIQEFPEFAGNSMYITGESYAGIYVPTIVREILQNPQYGLNLKGFAVGDGCLGNQVLCGAPIGPWYDIEFFHGHGQVSEDLYNTILALCPENMLKSGNLTSMCNTLCSEMYDSLGGYYEYNLYDDCPGSAYPMTMRSSERTWWGPPRMQKKPRTSAAARKLNGAVNDYPCPLDAYQEWLALGEVRDAIHVQDDAYFFDGDNGEGFVYNMTETNLLPFYQYVVTQTPLQVLVYNGDADPAINSMITQDLYFNYFASVGITQTQIWRPWTLDGSRMGGYVTEFIGNFSYLTIRGSGHMVPEYKPPMAQSFITSWLAGQDFLNYTASATQNSNKKHH